MPLTLMVILQVMANNGYEVPVWLLSIGWWIVIVQVILYSAHLVMALFDSEEKP